MTSFNDRNCFELVTLMALLKHNVGLYGSLARLEAVLTFIEGPPGSSTKIVVPDVSKAADLLRRVLIPLRSEPAIAEMEFITRQIDRVLAICERPKSPELTRALKELHSRIDDLLHSTIVYIVSPDKVKHYENPFGEWQKVPDSFPSAMDAIEEAEKCFALGRNTACVFHCMAIMDCGLAALGRHLRAGINPDTDTWEDIIKKIDAAINSKRTGMNRAAWKKDEAFYAEALSDLRSVKDAWRNPTMHFRRIYDEDQAAKVLERVRDFMIHLCPRVHERKRR